MNFFAMATTNVAVQEKLRRFLKFRIYAYTTLSTFRDHFQVVMENRPIELTRIEFLEKPKQSHPLPINTKTKIIHHTNQEETSIVS